MYDGTLKFDTSMDISGFQKSANGLSNIVKGLGIFSILQKGIDAVVGSLDSAVSRYDTLNQYPKVMQNLGYTAEEASVSLDKLSDGIAGLPTALDDAATYTKQWALATGDLEKATDLYLAINDGAIAYGASAQQAASVQDQLNQMISTGTYDLQSWKIIQQSCPGLLDAVAQSMLGESASASELRSALNDGIVSTENFEDTLISLDQNGTESIAAFSTAARDASGGIGTAWTNLKTAIVRGTTSIITAIDSGLSKTKFQGIEQTIDAMKNGISKALSIIADALGLAASKANILVPAVASLIAITKTYQVATAAATLVVKAAGIATEGVISLSTLHAAVLALLTKAKAADAVATTSAATALAMLEAHEITAAEASTLLTVKEALLAAAKGLLTGQIGLATAAQLVFNAVLAANPIGLVVVAVAALTASIVALVKWLGKGSEEYQKQTEEVEELTSAQEELTASLEESNQTFEDSFDVIEADSDIASNLVDSMYEVAGSTDSAASKAARMSSLVNQLNTAVDGLNIAYDEETGTLRNINSGQEVSLDQLRDLVDAKSELAKTDAWTQRQTELLSEQLQIQENLQLIEKKRQDILANAGLTAREQNSLIEELDASAAEYAVQMEDVEVRLAIVNENLAASAAETANEVVSDYELMESAVTETGENIEQVAEQWGVSTDEIIAAMKDQNISLDDWVSAQEEAMEEQEKAWEEFEETVKDKTDSVVNSFNEIPAEYDKSAAEMLEILQNNKEQYARWEANMEEITRLLGPTAAEEFGKLGPEANSAMEEILGSADLLAEYQEVFGVRIDEATGAAIEDWNDPDFIGAPTSAVEESAAQLASSTALREAAAAQVDAAAEATEDAIEKSDFSSFGEQISKEIQSSAENIDLSGVASTITSQMQNASQNVLTAVRTMMTGMSTTISAHASRVKNQAVQLASGITQALKNLDTDAKNRATQMMTQMALVFTARSSSVLAPVKKTAANISETLKSMETDGANHAAQMMIRAATAITAKNPAVVRQAKSLAASTSNALEPMVSGGQSASSRMMEGILAAMIAGSRSVYAKAAEIANTVAATMRNTLKIHSPSRVMTDIYKKVMLGAVNGLDSMKSMLYSIASNIAAGTSQRLTISPELAGPANTALLAASNSALYAAAPAAATASYTTSNSGTAGLLQQAIAILAEYLPAIANMQVVLDSGKTVGELAPAMDTALGRIARQKSRG